MFGKLKFPNTSNVSAASVAKARDEHYFNPPDYLVLEPEDTSSRTKNLQQTNTNGYKFQGTEAEFEKAKAYFQKLGIASAYNPSREFQTAIHKLFEYSNYRLDTNYAKIDRIEHTEIEAFKSKILKSEFNGLSVENWAKIIASNDYEKQVKDFAQYLGISER